MSAVLERIPAARGASLPRPAAASRHDRRRAPRHSLRLACDAVTGFALARRSHIDPFDPARAEKLILERCAAQIAAAAGAGAVLVEGGARPCRHASLLLAALAAPAGHVAMDFAAGALPLPALAGAGRRIVMLPGPTIGALAPAAASALMGRIGAWAGADALLVAGAEIRAALPAGRNVDADPRLHETHVLSLPRFERLAHAAGWVHCQFWSDGQARYALHVLERAS